MPIRHAALAAILTLVCLGAAAAADRVDPGAEHCVVNVRGDDALNLRAGPGTGNRVITRLPYARCSVMVTAPCTGNWCPVEDGHHAGWVHRHFIAAVSDAPVCLDPSARPRSAALRAWPSDGSRIVTRLAPGSCGLRRLPYRVGGWQKIRRDGWEGWLRSSDLVPAD